MLDSLNIAFDSAHLWLFESVVQPLLFALGASTLLEDAYDATMWALIGLLELLVLVCIVGILQRLRPAQEISEPRQVRTDILYTLIHRLGLFRLALYFTLLPACTAVFGYLNTHGVQFTALDELIPGVTTKAWVSVLIYLLAFDFVDYWYHRAQHHWWRFWALHAVHHSQRQLTMWSDNRNHLLDDFLRATVFVMLAYILGVPPGQFVVIVVLTQLLESLSHANARVSFGPWFDRLLVSPKYHRHHHSLEVDRTGESCNYAVLFPVWDILFGTARFDGNYGATGIHDQLEISGHQDYGNGFWAQQWLGIVRFFRPKAN